MNALARTYAPGVTVWWLDLDGLWRPGVVEWVGRKRISVLNDGGQIRVGLEAERIRPRNKAMNSTDRPGCPNCFHEVPEGEPFDDYSGKRWHPECFREMAAAKR